MTLKIDEKLLPMKGHYFLFNAGLAPLMPFIPTYARQLGIPQVGVGLMYTVFPFVGLLSKPLFGTIADKFKIGKVVFMAAIMLAAIFFSCIGFIPAKPTEALMDLDCGKMTILKTCEVHDNCTMTRIEMEKQDQEILGCSLMCEHPSKSLLDKMCTTWNVSDACASNVTLIEMTAYANLSKVLFEHNCLYFPLDSIVIDADDFTVEHPYCNDGTSTTKCHVICNSRTVMSYVQKTVDEGQHEQPYYETTQFQLLFLLMIGAWGSQSVVSSLADSVCFTLLGNKPQNYGVQRLWGAIGWGLSAVIAGFLIDVASSGKADKNYTPSFYMVFMLLTLNVLTVSRIKVDYHQEPYTFSAVLLIFKNVKVLLFLSCCITFGACIGITWQYLFWYLEILGTSQGCDSVHWSKLLQGLAMGIQCFAGEAPFLFLSGWFLNRLGHVYTMTMILVVMGFRLLCYSFLTNPWLTLPIELLQGITLGVYWSTMSSYAYLIAPPGAATTLQGVFGAIFEGIGTSIGSLLGGYIFQNFGGPAMFRSFGISAVLVGIAYGTTQFFMERNRPAHKDSVAGIEEYSSEESYSRVNSAPPKDDDA